MPTSPFDRTSSSFTLLDPRIQRWVWEKGWTSLRDAQEWAIPALVSADSDVIIAAATAAGKTEAAFLPILTRLLQDEPDIGSVLYVSPLKALINDQWNRLDALCDDLEIPVVPWHGDIAAKRKHSFLTRRDGIVLITPESLESLFVNRGSTLSNVFSPLRYVVVDELHSFIGSERGKQLQSLLNRIEAVVNRSVPRVGLSATLGDMRLAAEFLRPGRGAAVKMIVSESSGQELKVLVRGLAVTPPRINPDDQDEGAELEDLVDGSDLEIADHLFKTLRGSNNLVFPNSRRSVELYSDLLRRRCEREALPNEFWPHHGNLSKEIREETEEALKNGDRPATAICTTTLELGIDIGAVKSIAQIGPPPSVASLRQRLGRSGRREGEPAILRAYCREAPLGPRSALSDRLREGLIQTIAMIELLLRGWFEPPQVGGLHASTLVFQLLSVIAERGGVTASAAWNLLVESGTFPAIEKDDFIQLLRELGSRDLIVQAEGGVLLHGELGERFVNHYEFYSAFMTEDEFRITTGGRLLGTLPISHPLLPNSRVIFAGRRWKVLDVDAEHKVISVQPDPGGAPPVFESGGAMVHDQVRMEMRNILANADPISFLDARGAQFLAEARTYYAEAELDTKPWLSSGREVLLLTWRGDRVNDALTLLFSLRGFQASNEGVAISVSGDLDRVLDALDDFGRMETADPATLLADARNLMREKWDWSLPATLLRKSYASSWLDLAGAIKFAQGIA